MPIDSTNALASPKPIQTQDPNDKSKVNKEQFMKLLVTQLQNQDPLEPMDNREMILQLSQLTGVEQLVSIQQRIGALEIATAGMANTQVAALVGKDITADSSSLRLHEQGTARTVYSLDARADKVTAEIRDASGEVIRTIEIGGQFPGTHVLEWDGMSQSGERMPPGRYSVVLSATDAAGHPLEPSTEVSGRASGVNYEHGYPELVVGEARIMLGDVLAISE